MIRLTDEQWERIRKHFPEEHIPDGRAGRKPIPTRHVLEAVLWILNTGAQWHMLPQSYPNYRTVHRRFQTWCCNEILRRVLTDVANERSTSGMCCVRTGATSKPRPPIGQPSGPIRISHRPGTTSPMSSTISAASTWRSSA